MTYKEGAVALDAPGNGWQKATLVADERRVMRWRLIGTISTSDRPAPRPRLARRGCFSAKGFRHGVRIPLAIRRNGSPDLS